MKQNKKRITVSDSAITNRHHRRHTIGVPIWGDRIRERRVHLGMTQTDLANRLRELGHDRATAEWVGAVEAGGPMRLVEDGNKLALALGYRFDELINPPNRWQQPLGYRGAAS